MEAEPKRGARPTCYVCHERPARSLKPRHPFRWYMREPFFCSVRCAADFGLNHAHFDDSNPAACSECGHWNHMYEYDPVPACDACGAHSFTR